MSLDKLAPARCSDNDKLVHVPLRALAPVRYHLDDRVMLVVPNVNLSALNGLVDGDIDLMDRVDGVSLRHLPNFL